VQTVSAEDTAAAVKAAIASDEMTIIVSKCESGNVKVPVIRTNPIVNRERFMEEVRR
jgi:sulfopyruvate decarboxylase subunit beta